MHGKASEVMPRQPVRPLPPVAVYLTYNHLPIAKKSLQIFVPSSQGSFIGRSKRCRTSLDSGGESTSGHVKRFRVTVRSPNALLKKEAITKFNCTRSSAARWRVSRTLRSELHWDWITRGDLIVYSVFLYFRWRAPWNFCRIIMIPTALMFPFKVICTYIIESYNHRSRNIIGKIFMLHPTTGF